MSYEMRFVAKEMSGVCSNCEEVACGKNGYVESGPVTNVGYDCARGIYVAMAPGSTSTTSTPQPSTPDDPGISAAPTKKTKKAK